MYANRIARKIALTEYANIVYGFAIIILRKCAEMWCSQVMA